MHEATTHDTDTDAPPARGGRAALLHALAVVGGYSLFVTAFFAPVVFSERLVAPGDGMSYFLPNFYARRELWDSFVWGGFPSVGDSQLMTWYPPARLFALVGSWHAFLLSAYVLACSFAYAYAHAVTRSRLAAAVAGAVYGTGGFFVAHAGHAALVHAAAWTPALLWSLEKLWEARGPRSGRPRVFWFAAGAAVVACAALAGHPQIFVYTLALGGVYAIARGMRRGARRERLSYYSLCALLVALGTGLACVQLVPTAELARHSLRASLSFQDFVSYSLPVRQTPMLVFPYLFGGAPGTLYGRAYFGAWGSEDGGWGAGELSGYVGLLPLVLAAIGFIKSERRDLAWLWLAVGSFALLLALGDKTPLAHLSYLVPVVNKFRVPARHLMEVALAVAVLASFGVKAAQDGRAAGKFVGRVVAASACLLLACLALVAAFTGRISAWAADRLTEADGPLSFAPWSNAATAVPLLVLAAACAALLYWRARPASLPRRALLLAVLALDLASFGWFYEWHYAAPPRAYLNAPAPSASLRDELARTRQRLLLARGGTGRVAELPPNLSKLWGLPSASGYGPLILARVSRLLGMPPHGSTDAWRDAANRGPDLLAARYLLLPRGGAELPASSESALRFAAADFDVVIGQGCDAANRESFTFDLPRPASADSLAVVSTLACSVAVADGAEVARLTLTDTDGQTRAIPLVAGRDTAEWAHDCADVRPHVQHRRAEVFRSRAEQRPSGERCEAHDYLARLAVPEGLKEIKRIEIEWAGAPATLALRKLTLADARAGTSAPVAPAAPPGQAAVEGDAALDPARWRLVAEIDAANAGYGEGARAQDVGAAEVYENSRALPRAWLAREVLTVSEEEAFNAARTSRLADGREFDPLRHALVEEPFAHAAEAAVAGTQDAGAGAAEIVELSGERMEVVTEAGAPSFLVTSDVYYPGWEATVDGQRERVFQTDYVLRGVAVPAGRHRVRFEFRPKSLTYGAGVSLASLLLVAACSLLMLRRGARSAEAG